jgi:hypothetical protein
MTRDQQLVFRTVEYLESLGFDNSSRLAPSRYHVACSQCAALVINGTPAHETGCPNETHECAVCIAQIPNRQQYCDDCAQEQS